MMGSFYQKTLNQFEETELIVEETLASVNTMMPCEVTAIDYPKVTVKPLIKRIFINELDQTQYLDYGVISDIPVLTMGNSVTNISFPPPIVGDTGVILVSQGQVSSVYGRDEIDVPRKFDFTDAVYVPFFMRQESSESEKLTINSEKFNVKNDSNELITSIISALTAVKNLVTTGSETINPASQLLIQAEIDKIQTFQ